MSSALVARKIKISFFYFKHHISHFAFHISNRGFSLIELLVVVAIIGILSSGAIAAYNNFNKAQVVRRAALNLKSDLRESQNRATSGVKHADCRADGIISPPPDNTDDYDLKGHYVGFDTAVGSETKYDRAQICTPGENQLPVGSPDIIPSTELIEFPPSITISSLRFTDSS